jgi:hypothetical protein
VIGLEESKVLTKNFQIKMSRMALNRPIDPNVMNLINSAGICLLIVGLVFWSMIKNLPYTQKLSFKTNTSTVILS